MGKVAEKLPLIELPIGENHRSLGILEVQRQGKKVALPLASADVSARVADRVASVTVKQTFQNTLDEFLEAVYTFPLSGGCVVSDFELRVGGRIVKGIVQERAQARQQYQQALQQGKRAALLEQERDDVFTMQVGNLPPGEEATVVLTYSERLPFFEDGKTELRLPLVVAPRYIPGDAMHSNLVGHGTESDTDTVPDASRISPPRLAPGLDPNVKLAISVEIMQTDDSGSQCVSELLCSQHATQTNIQDGSVKVELSRDDERLNRDFVLRWRLARKAVKSSLLLFKNEKGDAYGMLSIIPPQRDGYVGAARDVLFVVDRSGSMGGVKMTSAARACSILLHTLGPTDRFAIQAFDNVSEWLADKNGDRFFFADEAGLEKGDKYLRGITARGGTELEAAMIEGFRELSFRPQADDRVSVLVLLTDGQVGDESRILKRIQHEIGNARLFTIGIDTAVNSGLLKRAANLGGGTCSLVQPGSNLESALVSVGREIGSPLITDLTVSGQQFKVDTNSMTPERIPDLFTGRAATAFFKLPENGTITVQGKWADGSRFEEKVKPKTVPVAAIAQLWAKGRITDLEDQYRASPNDHLKKAIIALSCEHSILTKFTAYVAVDETEIVNKTGNVKTVVQPVETPAEWDQLFDQSTTVAGMAAMPAPGSAAMRTRTVSDTHLDKLCGDLGESGSRCQGTNSPISQTYGSAPSAPLNAPEPGRPPANIQGPAQPPSTGKASNGFLQNLGNLTNGWSNAFGKKPADSAMRQVALNKINQFAELLQSCNEKVQSGELPNFQELEEMRQSLMSFLASDEAGLLVPKLQKFLRSELIELIASIKHQSVGAAGLQQLWKRHLDTFAEAEAEATNQLSCNNHGGGGGNFWESSI